MRLDSKCSNRLIFFQRRKSFTTDSLYFLSFSFKLVITRILTFICRPKSPKILFGSINTYILPTNIMLSFIIYFIFIIYFNYGKNPTGLMSSPLQRKTKTKKNYSTKGIELFLSKPCSPHSRRQPWTQTAEHKAWHKLDIKILL